MILITRGHVEYFDYGAIKMLPKALTCGRVALVKISYSFGRLLTVDCRVETTFEVKC